MSTYYRGNFIVSSTDPDASVFFFCFVFLLNRQPTVIIVADVQATVTSIMFLKWSGWRHNMAN